ncbi:MAG: hypothetical protein IKN65_08535 [Clostridia bacterium]|nr:hypothetical protein [Clostridia bacterium]MBR6127694.1 hypothetical protein [bacterium]
MIELNGIYKLKHIINFEGNIDDDFKVVAISKDKKMVACVQLTGIDAGERFVFMIECLLDPEHPEDKYYGELIEK